MYRIIFATLALLAALFRIFTARTPPIEAFLYYLIVFYIGLGGIFDFAGRCFKPDRLERQWRNLYGIFTLLSLLQGGLGVLCIWFGDGFRVATVVISSISIFSYGCWRLGHLGEIFSTEERPAYHTNFVLSFDLLVPIALIILLIANEIGR